MAYSVYIIELGDAAKAVGRVRMANPDMDPALPALYVGQTATDPEVRFQQHKRGHRASRVQEGLVRTQMSRTKESHENAPL